MESLESYPRIDLESDLELKLAMELDRNSFWKIWDSWESIKT